MTRSKKLSLGSVGGARASSSGSTTPRKTQIIARAIFSPMHLLKKVPAVISKEPPEKLIYIGIPSCYRGAPLLAVSECHQLKIRGHTL